MDLTPSFETFRELARDGGMVPVRREFLFDVDTAVTAYGKLARGPFGFLLESVVGGEQWARYSFLGSEPRGAWRLKGGVVSWWTPRNGWEPVECDNPLDDLRRRLEAFPPREVEGTPRFWGGSVGYLSYDLIRYLEHLPHPPPDDLDLPEGLLIFTDVVLAIDNLKGRAMAIRATPVEAGLSEPELRERYEEAGARLTEVMNRLATQPAPRPLLLPAEPTQDPEVTSNFSPSDFRAAVEKVREYILAGDVFQVVLSQRLTLPLAAPPFHLYRILRSLNPSPYLYFLELDGLSLVGSSPEVLVRLEGGRVTVRPIAGTRPRGATAQEDRELAQDLLADEKELAEHRMLVDLGRNDVGRVARFGTVSVPALMEVERYSHVMHICSQVEGELREGLGALEVLEACFPAGTVSGAPKIRAMEIIDELEPTRRGPYAGAVGYLGYGGESMDTAIAIRTVVVKDGAAHVQAGAGIVLDSVPEAEYQETRNKARALLRAGAMLQGEMGSQSDATS
ncbi:MAG: anthranilate synthase component I [Gemmatimonadota bacterium]